MGRRTLDCAQAGEPASLGASLVLELSEACYAQGGTEARRYLALEPGESGLSLLPGRHVPRMGRSVQCSECRKDKAGERASLTQCRLRLLGDWSHQDIVCIGEFIASSAVSMNRNHCYWTPNQMAVSTGFFASFAPGCCRLNLRCCRRAIPLQVAAGKLFSHLGWNSPPTTIMFINFNPSVLLVHLILSGAFVAPDDHRMADYTCVVATCSFC